MTLDDQAESCTKEPIIFLAWSPHWMNAVYNFHYLKDPKGLEKPFSDPSRITTVVNEDLEKDDPEAYAFLIRRL